jgi:cytochrome c oxidase subunit 2
MRFARVRLSRSARSRLVTPLVAALVGLAVAGCSGVPGLYPPAAVTDRGEATRNLYTIVFLIAVAIFFVVEGLILFAALRYHHRPARDEATPTGEALATELPPQIHGHMGLELLWTAVPVAIVLFLFVASWQTLNTVTARAANPATQITVVGFQWQWQFVYPDPANPTDHSKDVSIIGLPDKPPELHVPAGETVQITLRGQDVIHAFYVPQFLFKEDAVPGRNNVFQFKIDQPGTYRGQCAEFCGLGHDKMLFSVVAQTPSDFQAWLAAQRKPKPTPGASGGSSGPTVNVIAQNVAYTTTSLTAPANAPFSIAFANKDNGVPHNVAIKDTSGKVVFAGTVVTGPTSTTYQVPAIPAGTYTFFCQVHPNMTGTLTVK